MNNKLRKEIGITLIALTVMLIVLVILAAVTIVQIKNSGIIETMQLAKEVYHNSEIKENLIIDNAAYISSGRAEIDAIKKEILDAAYPVGSVYITVENNNPGDTIGGTWERVSEGRTLFGAGTLGTNTYTAGQTVNAGLPNITGFVGLSLWSYAASGAFYNISHSDPNHNNARGSSGTHEQDIYMNAARSSSIYGASNTVQPNAYVTYMWKRVE